MSTFCNRRIMISYLRPLFKQKFPRSHCLRTFLSPPFPRSDHWQKLEKSPAPPLLFWPFRLTEFTEAAGVRGARKTEQLCFFVATLRISFRPNDFYLLLYKRSDLQIFVFFLLDSSLLFTIEVLICCIAWTPSINGIKTEWENYIKYVDCIVHLGSSLRRILSKNKIEKTDLTKDGINSANARLSQIVSEGTKK